MSELFEFWAVLPQYTFLQYAFMTSIAVGLICGVIGCFIILRGMSLMGDAISHAVLPGVAISFLLGWPMFIGAAITGLATALGIGFVSQNSRVKQDASIGILFTAAFALGIILIMSLQSSASLHHILFGNVLAVRPSEMYLTFVIGAVVLSLVYLFYKELLITSFDPTMSAAFGLPNRWIHYGLLAMLTLVTVASLQTVGIVLVVSMLITPAATAYLLSDSLKRMMALAAFFGSSSAVLGLWVSYTFNVASGATIVLMATFFFALAFIFSPKHGMLIKRIRRMKRRAAH